MDDEIYADLDLSTSDSDCGSNDGAAKKSDQQLEEMDLMDEGLTNKFKLAPKNTQIQPRVDIQHEKLKLELEELKKQNSVLEQNLVLLYKTAHHIIQLKDKELSNLKTKYDEMCFRKNGKNPQNSLPAIAPTSLDKRPSGPNEKSIPKARLEPLNVERPEMKKEKVQLENYIPARLRRPLEKSIENNEYSAVRDESSLVVKRSTRFERRDERPSRDREENSLRRSSRHEKEEPRRHSERREISPRSRNRKRSLDRQSCESNPSKRHRRDDERASRSRTKDLPENKSGSLPRNSSPLKRSRQSPPPTRRDRNSSHREHSKTSEASGTRNKQNRQTESRSSSRKIINEIPEEKVDSVDTAPPLQKKHIKEEGEISDPEIPVLRKSPRKLMSSLAKQTICASKPAGKTPERTKATKKAKEPTSETKNVPTPTYRSRSPRKLLRNSRESIASPYLQGQIVPSPREGSLSDSIPDSVAKIPLEAIERCLDPRTGSVRTPSDFVLQKLIYSTPKVKSKRLNESGIQLTPKTKSPLRKSPRKKSLLESMLVSSTPNFSDMLLSSKSIGIDDKPKTPSVSPSCLAAVSVPSVSFGESNESTRTFEWNEPDSFDPSVPPATPGKDCNLSGCGQPTRNSDDCGRILNFDDVSPH